MTLFFAFLRSAVFAVMAAVPSAALAQSPAPAAPATIPALSDYFKRAAFSEVVTSPNGKYLASTSENHGRLNLVVIDLDTRKSTWLTSYDNIDIGRIQWVGNDRVIFGAIQLNAPTGQDSPRAGGFFSVSRNGTELRQFAKTASQMARSGPGPFVALSLVRPVPGSSDEMIGAGVVAGDDSVDLYRVNLSNGRYRLLTQGRPSDRLSEWLIDSKMVPRVAMAGARGASTANIIYYRSDKDADWAELTRFDTTKPPAFVPLGFDSDDKTLFVAMNEGRKNMAIYRYDPEAKKVLELVAEHAQYDLGASPLGQHLGSLIREPVTGKLLGFQIDADKPINVWVDERFAKLQATVDRALPGRTNSLRPTNEGSRFVINSYSSTSPGTFYLFDAEKLQLEEIGPARQWLEGKLAEVRPFTLKTRDGLSIPSFYVLPRDHKVGTKLPTVFHIHGGPMARDVRAGGQFGGSFGVREAQILAARGYAVVLPNFRVTPEIGSSIYYAGFGSYGKEMSDDHEDAVKWAVDQGFADPKRMCISGASYGGYASLHAVSRPTNPFACAISGLPVTDLKFQRTEADYASNSAFVEYWRKLQGVPDFNDPLVGQLSPLFNANKIKVPVFMYIGDADTRTPPAQARRMAEELAKVGNPVKDMFVGKGEGHGYGVETTNVELYARMLKFLEASIGK